MHDIATQNRIKMDATFTTGGLLINISVQHQNRTRIINSDEMSGRSTTGRSNDIASEFDKLSGALCFCGC